jgi:hypothetical protein
MNQGVQVIVLCTSVTLSLKFLAAAFLDIEHFSYGSFATVWQAEDMGDNG